MRCSTQTFSGVDTGHDGLPNNPNIAPLPIEGSTIMKQGLAAVNSLPGYHSRMRELTTDNAEQYLRERGLVPAGPVRVRELGDGVSGAVLRVEAGERKFVIKQSRPRLRTRDPWF